MTITGSLTNTNKYITIELWLKNMGGSAYRGSTNLIERCIGRFSPLKVC